MDEQALECPKCKWVKAYKEGINSHCPSCMNPLYWDVVWRNNGTWKDWKAHWENKPKSGKNKKVMIIVKDEGEVEPNGSTEKAFAKNLEKVFNEWDTVEVMWMDFTFNASRALLCCSGRI